MCLTLNRRTILTGVWGKWLFFISVIPMLVTAKRSFLEKWMKDELNHNLYICQLPPSDGSHCLWSQWVVRTTWKGETALGKFLTSLTNSTYTWIFWLFFGGAGFLYASGLAAFLFFPCTHLLKRWLGSEAEIQEWEAAHWISKLCLDESGLTGQMGWGCGLGGKERCLYTVPIYKACNFLYYPLLDKNGDDTERQPW